MRCEQIGNATLYCGDCLEILPEISGVGCVVTDPPYMLRCASDYKNKLNPWADLCNGAVFISAWMRLALGTIRGSAAMWVFSNWRGLPAFQKAGFECRAPLESLLVWDKQYIGPGSRGLRPQYELVGFYPVNGHPAEKPQGLVSRLLEISVPIQGAVLDPFMGSGTTGAAAIQMGLPFIGIEIDPQWFDAACRRVEASLSIISA